MARRVGAPAGGPLLVVGDLSPEALELPRGDVVGQDPPGEPAVHRLKPVVHRPPPSAGPASPRRPAAEGEIRDANTNHGGPPAQGMRIGADRAQGMRMGRIASRRASASKAVPTSASGYTWVVSGSVRIAPEASRAIMAG